jgi:hypothetical protein
MANLTQDRDTRCRYYGPSKTLPMKTGVKIFAGSIVALDATGYAIRATDAANLVVKGIAAETVDNTAGADGALRITVRAGVFEMNKAAGLTSPVGAYTNQSKVYVDDDNTVGVAGDTANTIVAGWVEEFDPTTGLPWVAIGLQGL